MCPDNARIDLIVFHLFAVNSYMFRHNFLWKKCKTLEKDRHALSLVLGYLIQHWSPNGWIWLILDCEYCPSKISLWIQLMYNWNFSRFVGTYCSIHCIPVCSNWLLWMQPQPIKPLNSQICQICGDTVGLNAIGDVFVACNECAFPVCRSCYEYERKDGNQSCPQCKTRYKRHKGEISWISCLRFFSCFIWVIISVSKMNIS